MTAATSPLALDTSVLKMLSRGVALVVGSANQALEPEVCRAWGPSWKAGCAELELLLPLPAGASTLDNLEQASAVAFTFAMPTDYRAFQLKGHCVASSTPSAEQWQRARHHFDAFLAEMPRVGLQPQAFAPWFPAEGRVITARIESVYCQAPGANAGVAL